MLKKLLTKLRLCQAQPQLQLQLWLRLALIPISPAIPPPKKVFEHHLDGHFLTKWDFL